MSIINTTSLKLTFGERYALSENPHIINFLWRHRFTIIQKPYISYNRLFRYPRIRTLIKELRQVRKRLEEINNEQN